MSKSRVYSLHYNLKNVAGDVVDTSHGGAPLTFLEGTGAVVEGIEKALEGRSPGEVLEVTVPPEMAYGDKNPELIVDMPAAAFDGVEEVVPGMTFQTNTGVNAQVVKVAAVNGETVTVDGNHPLAGFTLYFELTLLAVREATDEEIESGQVIG